MGIKKEIESIKEYRDEVIEMNDSLGKSIESNKIVLSSTKEKLSVCKSRFAKRKTFR